MQANKNDADNPVAAVAAVILAGGRATRMGGEDKGLIMFQDEPFAAHVGRALQPQTAEVLLNANRNLEAYRQLNFRVIADTLHDHQGPLAGMHAALSAIAHDWLLTAPCDGPFIAADYAARMFAAARAQNTRLAVARDATRLQPVYALIHRRLTASLGKFLSAGERKIDRWYAMHNFVEVDFSDTPRMFVNVNTPGDLEGLRGFSPPLSRGG